ncbi:hypothetical protein SAMN05192583_1014 [Sphingomonas gellani]|uniref:Uncharacterized protein n=1 Tax=Sphingomonas gellani TaxID=1166340 RepID=A0A1H8AQ62_9SPHN|nr:hypothetical protein SAMN05192583_1014 [Sphingomonas gellani]
MTASVQLERCRCSACRGWTSGGCQLTFITSSGGRPDAAPLTDPDVPATVTADMSAPQGRPVETPAPTRRGARGHKPETVS